MKKVKKGTIGFILITFLASIIFPMLGLAQTWDLITQPAYDFPVSIGVPSNRANQMSVTSEHDGIFGTATAGTTPLKWTFVNSMGLVEVHESRILASPSNNDRLYVLGTHGDGAYSPSNGSLNSWVTIAPGTDSDKAVGIGDPWLALAIDPTPPNPATNPNTLLAGGWNVIRHSTDGGVTWTTDTVVPPNTFTNTLVTDIEQVDGLNAWAATSKSPAWSEPYMADPQPTCQRVLLGSYNAGNNTWTWTQTAALHATIADANCVHAIAPLSATATYAATKRGLYFTSNGGSTWDVRTPQALVPPNDKINDIFYAYSTVYIATNQGVYLCTAGANCTPASWTQIAIPPPLQTARPVNAIYGSTDSSIPAGSRTLYAVYKEGDLYKIVNNGASVTALTGHHSGYLMSTSAILPNSSDNTVYTGTVCQGGVFQGTLSGSTWSWTKKKWGPNEHDHFHYVMRIAQHPSNAQITYVTDSDQVYRTQDAGATWTVPHSPTATCPPPNPNNLQCGIHLHGLAIAPSDPTVLYVGTGFGLWGTHPHGNFVWRATNGGQLPTDWEEITNNFPPPPAGQCCHAGMLNCPSTNHSGCTSMISIAVEPTDRNIVHIGTFGSENDPGDGTFGKGIGVFRSINAMAQPKTAVNWTQINNGLCPDGAVGPCTGSLLAGSLSLFVGTVVMNAGWVQIATLNGIYELPVGGATWRDISPDITNTTLCPTRDDCRRFESIAVDPCDPQGKIIYVGTSPPTGNPAPAARILKGTYTVATDTWGWQATNITMADAERAWSDRFRVRDLRVGIARAYAMVEGRGIYSANLGRTSCPTGPSSPRR